MPFADELTSAPPRPLFIILLVDVCFGGCVEQTMNCTTSGVSNKPFQYYKKGGGAGGVRSESATVRVVVCFGFLAAVFEGRLAGSLVGP